MKIFKSAEMKRAEQELILINELAQETKSLSDSDLQIKTSEFKKRLEDGETTDDIRVEAFAVAREATERILKKRPYDVQMIGGLILDYGSVAEMRTGEGKTITSIAPVYLNALTGKGVIVSTVNEYLTRRDAEETGEVHNFLGLTVGINEREMQPNEKRLAYQSDITYSIHSEIGFDYLRDNMVKRIEDKVQRGFNYALIDEVDSILIDEARTPLIITGGEENASTLYMAANQFTRTIGKDDYEIDWESKSIQLTDQGIDKANKFFGVENVFNIENSELIHRILNALRANHIMYKDSEYIVHKEEIMLVDAFTGRIMEGRSYSDGLQQALQAKEGVKIDPETKTMATITYQNLFRMFTKLSGMSGTAVTEEDEFIDIYNMRVNVVPTNKPIIRKDEHDNVYVEKQFKYKAIVNEIKERNIKGQPILVGTEEVSESEKLSSLLKKEGVKHTVLNAKQNETEAEIIAEAGKKGAVTIATNMAGRGTDIKLTDETRTLGGLYVIGTSKAESRRIDNQLKGRSGRQGDPGESRFFISLDDSLLSRFSNQEKLKNVFKSSKDMPIKGKTIVKALNRAQKKIEGFNYDSRKNVLQYDDVIRQQRDLIYVQRDIIIGHSDLIHIIERMIKSVVRDVVNFPNFKRKDGSLDIENLVKSINVIWFSLVDFKLDVTKLKKLTRPEMIASIQKDLQEVYDLLRQRIIDNTDEDVLHNIEREILLSTFDENWTLHIDQMSKLKSSSSLASYAQKNPYQVYVEKGAELFNQLLERISHNTVRFLLQNPYARIQETQEELDLKASINAANK